MIKNLLSLLSKKKADSYLFVETDVFDDVNIEDLVDQEGISFKEFKKTKSLSSIKVIVDLKALYRRAQQEGLLFNVVRVEGAYYGIDNIDQAFVSLRDPALSGAFFVGVPSRVVKDVEYRSPDGELLYLAQAPVFQEVDSIIRKNSVTFEALTTSGEKMKAHYICYVSTNYLDCVRHSSIKTFNKIVDLVDSLRSNSGVRSVYFTEPFELSYSHFDYDSALMCRGQVESKIAFTQFNAIYIVDDGIYLRDASRNIGKPFLLFISLDQLEKIETDDESCDEYSDESPEYIDYGDDDESDDYGDGSHCCY